MNMETPEQEPEVIMKWLSEWWKRADDEEKSWMKVQMKRCFPEYIEWLKEAGDH